MIDHATEDLRLTLERVFPGWKVWVVHRAVGGPLWCARRWDENGPVLNEATPEALGEQMARADQEDAAG